MAAYGLSIGPIGSPSTIIILDITRRLPRLNQRRTVICDLGRARPKHNGAIEAAEVQ